MDLCSELSRDYEVIGIDIINSQSGFIKCDIADKDKTIKSIVDAKPDLIIHAAAWTDVDGCESDPPKAEEINSIGTKNVTDSASRLDIPCVYISTDFVFDGNKTSPYKEEDVPSPINVYGRSKFMGEKSIKSLKEYIILRTSWLFGMHGKNFVDTIIKKAKKENSLKVVSDQLGTPTYAKDLAKAISKMLQIFRQKKAYGIYHISNKGVVSWFDYAKEILKLSGFSNIEIKPIKSDELSRPAKRPAFSVLDNAKFENTFGFVMRNWQDALKDFINEKK